jgi:DNA-binding NtrC family response regulator
MARFSLQPTPAAPPPATSAPSQLAASSEIRPLEDVIRSTIEQAIEFSGGSIPRAAAALKVSASTLYRRIQSWENAAPNEHTAGTID